MSGGLGPDAQPGSVLLEQTTQHPDPGPENVSQTRTLGPALPAAGQKPAGPDSS